MKVTDNKIDELNYQVEIEVAPEDYAAAMKKMLNERKRTADFRGFRKGMAPMSMIKRVYGEQALVESVNEVLSKNLNSYIKDNNIHVVGEPLASEDQPEIEWKEGNTFNFKFDIAQTPELMFEVSKDADTVPYYKINVTAAARKEMKENMLRQFGELQETESAGEEDFVIVDMANEGHSVDNVYVSVRSVAGDAKKKFVGAKAGDKFDVNVNEAFVNESDRAAMLKVKKEELAGLDPVFHVSVVNVKTFVAAAESQETYDKIFGADKVHNSDEFDKAVTERLTANYKQEADFRLSKDLRTYFVDKAGIKLPEAFLKRWLLHVNEGKFTAEDIDKEFDAFLADFKWQMVRDYLMDKYQLKVDEKDMQTAAEAFVAYQYAMYGMGNVPQDMLKDAARHALEDERQARQIFENVEDQKVIDAVKQNITLSDKKISVEKFRELK